MSAPLSQRWTPADLPLPSQLRDSLPPEARTPEVRHAVCSAIVLRARNAGLTPEAGAALASWVDLALFSPPPVWEWTDRHGDQRRVSMNDGT
jgi:hypothetical protein